MAHHQSAIKRIRQTKKRKIYNRMNKKMVKEAIKAVKESKTYEEATENFRLATKTLDKVTAHGVIHKNYAANRKSKLSKFVKSLKSEG